MELITYDQAAEVSGIHKDTLRKLARNQELRSWKRDGDRRVYLDKAEVLDYTSFKERFVKSS